MTNMLTVNQKMNREFFSGRTPAIQAVAQFCETDKMDSAKYFINQNMSFKFPKNTPHGISRFNKITLQMD